MKIKVYSLIYEGHEPFDFTQQNYLKFCKETKTDMAGLPWKKEKDGSRTIKCVSTAGEKMTIKCRDYALSFVEREMPWVFEQIAN